MQPEEVGARLAVTLRARPAAGAPAPRPLVPAHAPRVSVAVDGSSVVLAQAHGGLLAAYRAACVRVEGRASRAEADAPAVVLLGPDAPPSVRERVGTGLSPEAALDALRSLAEIDTAIAALATMRPGDLLLVDGALQARHPSMDAMLARAREVGVDVVGVCKSTSLVLDGVPALAACQAAAREAGLTTWSAPLPTPPLVRGRVFAARLLAAEPRAFRFDVGAADDDAERVLRALASLGGHPAYPGYPSPLAMAHNAALLDDAERRRLLARVEEGALRAGLTPAEWEAACVDYHDVLELGA